MIVKSTIKMESIPNGKHDPSAKICDYAKLADLYIERMRSYILGRYFRRLLGYSREVNFYINYKP